MSWPCGVCGEDHETERSLQRHVSRNWPRCGTMREAAMASYGRAVASETTQTWEHGKLKITLTRKSDSNGREKTATVLVVNKDSDTRGESGHWSGPVDKFDEYVASLTCLHGAVNGELHPVLPEAAKSGCYCPVQHDALCPICPR